MTDVRQREREDDPANHNCVDLAFERRIMYVEDERWLDSRNQRIERLAETVQRMAPPDRQMQVKGSLRGT